MQRKCHRCDRLFTPDSHSTWCPDCRAGKPVKPRKTEDDFRQEILEPYVNARALVFEVFKVFKLFEEEWMKIKFISFKWHKEMPRVITEVKYVLLITNKKGDECTISTSWLQVEEETQDKLIPLVEEIEMFVRGARAQGKLWEEELEADAVDGETFHINDLVQEGEADD